MACHIPGDVQKEILAVLLSRKGGVPLLEFPRDYNNLVGHELNYRSLGFKNLKELFLSVPDMARIVQVKDTNMEKVYGVHNGPVSSMNITERQARYVPKDGEIVRTSAKDMPSNGRTKLSSKPGVTAKDQSLRRYVEENLVCNRKGLWSLCFPLTKARTAEDVIHHFSPYGQVVETSFTSRYGFVRFKTKEQAVQAYLCLKEDLDLDVATEKLPYKTPTNQGSSEENYNNIPYTEKPPEKIGIFDKSGNKYIRSFGRGSTPCLLGHSSSAVGASPKTQSPKVQTNLDRTVIKKEESIVKTSQPSWIGASDKVNDMPPLEDIDDLPSPGNEETGSDRDLINVVQDKSLNPAEVRGYHHHHQHDYHDNSKYVQDPPPGRNSNCAGLTKFRSEDLYELCVRNFPYNTTPAELLKPFKLFGASGVKIVRNEPGFGTLAFIQFLGYDLAVNAYTTLDSTDFNGRQLQVAFSERTFCSEATLKKKLKNLRIKVMVKGDDEMYKSTSREVSLEEDKECILKCPSQHDSVFKQRQQPSNVQEQLKPNRQSWQQTSNQQHELHNKPPPQPRLAQQQQQQEQQYYKTQHSKRLFNRELQPQQCEKKQHSEQQQGAVKQQQLQQLNKQWQAQQQGRQQEVPLCNAKDKTNIAVRENAQLDCLHGNKSGMTRTKLQSVEQDDVHHLGASDQDAASSSIIQDLQDFSLQNSDVAEANTLLLHSVTTPDNNEESKIPPMMRHNNLDQMMSDVFPGYHRLTVNDLRPEIEVLIVSIENETYFWGHIISDEFKQNIEELLKITQQMMEVSHSKPITGKRAIAQFAGDWSRVWVYRCEKDKAHVMYVDYGNTEIVDYSQLSEVNEEFWQLAPVAVPFRLKDPSKTSLAIYKRVELNVDPSGGDDYIITVSG